MDQSSVPVSDPNSLLRSLLASSGDCIKILDLDGNLIFMTEGGQRIMQVTDFAAIKGCPWPNFWEGQGNTNAKAAVEAARGGKTGHFQGFATTMAGTPKWWDVIVTLIRDADGKPDRLLCVSRDITETRVADAAVRESEARFKTFAQAMPNQVWSATPDGLLDWFNDRVFAFSGLTFDDLCGEQWARIVHPDDLGAAAAIWAKALATGTQYQTEFRLRRADGALRWHLARAVPIKDASGVITRWIGTNTDIDDQKAAEAQQQLLARELEHRMKNTMAMVGAIASQTFRTAATKEEARTIFDARLSALNQAHDLLVRSNWSGASMRAVVEGALAPYRTGEGRIRVGGPDVSLGSKKALSLALALHELATNATKYGSLSAHGGTIDVTWDCSWLNDAEMLRFCWRESGGPAVSPPSRRGFGSRLIESTLASDFGNTVKVVFPPEGVVCSFQIKLSDLADEAEARIEL
jgi:PAS domain S-box-containing protein